MTIQIGYSPCPNDTFIFDAMIHRRIDTEGLTFEPILADVEQLNQWALEGKLPMTKLSYHAYAYMTDNYVLLNAGSALGRGCGPLLIAKKEVDLETLIDKKIAIPGKYTTANFLLGLALPNAQNKVATLFSEIEQDVLNDVVDAGLIIHENRFTYMEKGLVKLIDLGDFWEKKTGLPIPLGGIVVHRNLDLDVQQKIDRVLRRSVEYAFANPNASMPYIREHAQEMDDAVMKQHITLYVNDFSVNLGQEGRKAIEYLFEKAQELELIPRQEKTLFVAQ